MTEVKLKTTGTQLVGVGIAGQALALGFGNVVGIGFVSVVTNSGNPYQWQFVNVGSDGQSSKFLIGTQDGQSWWRIPGNNLMPNCVSIDQGPQSIASTIVYDYATSTLNASSNPQFLAPTGGAAGFYFATNNQASSPVVFYAIG
jgi:hypothetical protein